MKAEGQDVIGYLLAINFVHLMVNSDLPWPMFIGG
jgi:hypothetical protein